MKRLDYPGIVKFIDYLEDEGSYYLVMEYISGGELFDYIISHTRVEESLAKRIFKQIAYSVGYIHSKNIVHRDLKPENLLMTDSTTVKIIDFGLCSIEADKPLTNKCGSPIYISPEALTGEPYMGPPADVWALGVILYAIVDGSVPWNYKDPEEMQKQISTGSFLPIDNISDECRELIVAILNPDPSKRIDITGILAHPWLFGIRNVFPHSKPCFVQRSENLSLSVGGFSSSNFNENQQPLGSLYTESVPSPKNDPSQKVTLQNSPEKQKIQPRSISLNVENMNDDEIRQGAQKSSNVLLSQTISHRDPMFVAKKLENAIISANIAFEKENPLLYTLTDNDLQAQAEICRLQGFRNIFIISFKKIKGDDFKYTNFVSPLLDAFKKH
ncbi:CAMK family protein kinase [Trichomonas vaginalis G3]|uniref:CAMK family protein kinase n=1 Tax=Trichomonas vaginalis (strain ATCC PRA-98 / G3) TaxID=412133 RepID=A2EWU5_TRIV3|nr:protein serine/threonine kinase protein [Trichomonas vaginalis G3]EAY02860.1 CAMK family protein kinase [Trichomonas vaginalis G3]KAI5497374.1 protein serine/threonine kinase protein [Trichomonas vaginalis G3]|eukprot:XP_001315083.1 CAMK family protein kinase [Trichomonas vaginalis G3]